MKLKSILSHPVPLFLCVIIAVLLFVFGLCLSSDNPDYRMTMEPLYYSKLEQGNPYTYEAHLNPASEVYIARHELGASDGPAVINGTMTEIGINTYLFSDPLGTHTQILTVNKSDGTIYFYDRDTELSVCLYPSSAT